MKIGQRTARVQWVNRNGVSIEMALTMLAPSSENGNHVSVRMGVLEARRLAEQLTEQVQILINEQPRGVK